MSGWVLGDPPRSKALHRVPVDTKPEWFTLGCFGAKPLHSGGILTGRATTRFGAAAGDSKAALKLGLSLGSISGYDKTVPDRTLGNRSSKSQV